jgi:hypothetical protein
MASKSLCYAFCASCAINLSNVPLSAANSTTSISADIGTANCAAMLSVFANAAKELFLETQDLANLVVSLIPTGKDLPF